MKNTTATYAIDANTICTLRKGDKVSFVGPITNDKHITRSVHIDNTNDGQPYVIVNKKDYVIGSACFLENAIVTAINGTPYEYQAPEAPAPEAAPAIVDASHLAQLAAQAASAALDSGSSIEAAAAIVSAILAPLNVNAKAEAPAPEAPKPETAKAPAPEAAPAIDILDYDAIKARRDKKNAAILATIPEANRQKVANKLAQLAKAGYPLARLERNKKHQLDGLHIYPGVKGQGRDKAFKGCTTKAARDYRAKADKAAKAGEARPKAPVGTFFWSPVGGGNLYARGIFGPVKD